MTYAFRFSCGHTSSQVGRVDEWLDCDWPCANCRRAGNATVEKKSKPKTSAQTARPPAQTMPSSAHTDITGCPCYHCATVATYQWPVTFREESGG